MDWKSKRATAILELALIEDHATADATTALALEADLPASATILAKQECVLAGLGMVPRVLEVFAKLDTGKPARRFEVVHHPEIFDGVHVRKGQAVAVIRHNARTILACERVILNLLQRMCGIATLTRQYVDAVAGTGAVILDTRKTVPGLRMFDKYAVTCGGGTNHRMDLADGVLIKNNHISLGGGIPKVLARAHSLRKPGQKIQIEVRTLEELALALDGGADSLLLDNMTPADVQRAVKMARQRDEHITLEASGGMTLEMVHKYAKTGVDFISVGALTHSVKAVDLSMRTTAEIY
ncbi:MAG: carboxylating nicotinate-nucleotide diphosphorylase [Acidobacteriaceae bacterium]